mgnify:CR=1 FL=1
MSQLNVLTVDTGSASDLLLKRNGTTKLTVGSGTVTLADTLTTNGIAFPATQSASSDANTLDDYEEGDWTPTLLGGSSAGTTTYTIQAGSYTKVGRSVTCIFDLSVSAMTGTGELRIGGLPFSAASGTKFQTCGAVMTNGLNWSGGTSPVLYIDAATNYLNFYISADDANWTNQQCVNESQRFIGNITYFTT